jgi:alkanesulfonate monooxygenase SsuD/methylene tetrahydromethanopterin reductase-like flavin-dependent oxidoreductase (luciferase family)
MTESPIEAQSLTMQRPFRFGVVSGAARGGADWTATARRLESAGFSSLLVPDVLDGPAPLLALAAAAAVTSTLRIGSYVAVAGLRPPGMLAWEAGSLQALSDGRFELGLGLGRPDAEKDARRLGVPLGVNGARVARLVEVLDAVQALPEQRRPRILIAAGGPRMLQLAGRRADTVALGLSPLATPQDLARVAGTVRWAAQERPAPPELATNLLVAGDGDVPDWVRERMGIDPQVLRAAGAASLLTGNPQQMADTLLRRRDETGVSYLTGGVHLIEALAPVLERLVGR